MNTQSTRSRNRRRYSNNRRSSGNGRSYSRSDSSPRSKPKPTTLWERILAFFKGKPATRSTSANTANTARSYAASPSTAQTSSGGRTMTPPRTPEIVEVTTARLYVGNLSFDAGENDLTELFNGVGSVASAEVVTHRRTQRSKGFAFVQMQTVEEARRAVEVLHDQEFMGRKLVVSGAKSQDATDDSDRD